MRSHWARVRRAREERGDTLLEVLFTVLVISIAGVALLFGFAGSITGSSSHRNLVSGDVALRTVAESVYSQMQQQSSPLIDLASYSCISVGSAVPSPSNSWNTPSGYGATVTLYAYWAPSGWQYSGTPSCSQKVPEEFQVSLTQPQGPPLATYVVVNGFTSSSSGLAITSISPATVAPGSTNVTLVIYGTGFQSGITGSFSGSDITFSDTGSPSSSGSTKWSVSPPSSIVATVNVKSGVTSGTVVTLTVTNPDHSSAQGTITISPLPSITQVDTGSTVTTGSNGDGGGDGGDDDQNGNGTPSCSGPTFASLVPGQTGPLTINGSNFQPGAVVSVSSPDISFVSSGNPPTYFNVNASGTQITATVSVTPNPTAGTYYVTVVNPGGSAFTSNTCSLVIANPPPTITSVSASPTSTDGPCVVQFTGQQSNDRGGGGNQPNTTCYVNGTNFDSTATVTIVNNSNGCQNAPSASSPVVLSSTQIQITVSPPQGCGSLNGQVYSVTVTALGGTTPDFRSAIQIKGGGD